MREKSKNSTYENFKFKVEEKKIKRKVAFRRQFVKMPSDYSQNMNDS